MEAYIDASRDAYSVRNYVGQSDYADILSSSPVYADQEIVLVDRNSGKSSTSGISASAICSDPTSHWNEIHPSFRCFFRKCVVLVGAESTGKSTLSRMLADRFGGSLAVEYGRVWTEGWRHRIESDLDAADYLAFVAGQLAANEDALYAISDARVCFCDTDGFVTSAYLICDAENMNPHLVRALYDVAEISRRWTATHADAILVLPNDVEFEMDGSRDGHLAQTRDEYRECLIGLLQDERYGMGGRVHLIEEGSLDDKFNQCARIVEEVLAGETR